MDRNALETNARRVLDDATIPELPNHYRGKVRDNYDLPDGRRILIATDRLSAFDVSLAAIPFKGEVLTRTARFWFEATGDICPNHVLEYPDPNVVIGQRLDILPVEMVVRDYLAGTTGTSLLTLYKAGRRDMYGLCLPDGLGDNAKLPQTVITPTSKAALGSHDEPLTPDDIIARGLLSAEQWRTVCDYSLALFERGRAMAAERGLILVDTKYEFGTDSDGRIVLADEIHTPDSSRYWFLDSYAERVGRGEKPESFDKDFMRNWVVARCDPYKDSVPPIPQEVVVQTAEVYITAFETITGQTFEIPEITGSVLDRIRGNLARFF